MKQLIKIFGTGTLTVLMVVAIFYAVGQHTKIMAEETNEKKYESANEIAIHTIFTFREGIEKIDGFQVYNQMSGFVRQSESPTFKLEGVVNSDKSMLYEAADMYYKRGLSPWSQHEFSQFDVDIYLHQNGVTLRHFKYTDCDITEYKIGTLFDKEEAWFGKGFAIVDEFEFTCSGYQPNNPLY
ncbi:MAG: hypothetical protein ACE5RJ_04240, partial [Nitrosopumilaceae archaeon]